MPTAREFDFDTARCGLVRVLACFLACAVALALASCQSQGIQEEAATSGEPASSNAEPAPDLVAQPTPGTPAACACGPDCPDPDCVQAREAYDLGLYPWLTRTYTTGSDAPLYGTFLGLPQPEYEVVGGAIAGDKPLIVESVILNTFFNGPSTASQQNLYELVLLDWLAYDDGTAGTEDSLWELTTLAVDFVGLAADQEGSRASEYEKLLSSWKGLTGQDLGDSILSDAGVLGKYANAADNALLFTTSAERMVESWSRVSDALDTSASRIELLAAARDNADDNPDFVAAATRVIDAYEAQLSDDLTLDDEGNALLGDQGLALASDIATDGLWAYLSVENPLLTIGRDAIDALFTSGDDSAANMGMLGIYIVAPYLRTALDNAETTAASELAGGGEAPTAATFVSRWRAYLAFQMYALDETASWARTIGDRTLKQDEVEDVVSRATTQRDDRRQLLELMDTYVEIFVAREGRALNGRCSCGCADPDARKDTGQDEGIVAETGQIEYGYTLVEEQVSFPSYDNSTRELGPNVTETWVYPQFIAEPPTDAIDKLNAAILADFEAAIERARTWDPTRDGERTTTYLDSVTYLDGGYACVRHERYVDAGGAHGTSFVSATTYDLETGMEISLEGVFGGDDSLASAAEAGVRTFYEEHPELTYGMGVDETTLGEVIRELDRYYASDRGIVFIVRPYEFGPFAAGGHEILITSFGTAAELYQDVSEEMSPRA